jgi:hypothetical protein
MYLGNGLAPYSQTLKSLSIPPGCQSWLGKLTEHSSNGFDNLKNSTNLDITILLPDVPPFTLKDIFCGLTKCQVDKMAEHY